jgi:hypothetical protein
MTIRITAVLQKIMHPYREFEGLLDSMVAQTTSI